MKKSTSLFCVVIVKLLFVDSFSSQTSQNQSVHFRENKGQVSDQFYNKRNDVLYSGTVGDLIFHLKNNGISYQFNRFDEWTTVENNFLHNNHSPYKMPSKSTMYRLDVNWLNTNPTPVIKQGQVLEGHDNFYLESCPDGAVQVRSYKDVTFTNLYKGIDLKWYEKNGILEYDYLIAAGADYKMISLEYKGAEKIYTNENGDLVVQIPLGTIKEQKPVVMQANKFLDARWIITGNIISFDIKNVDPSLPLIIDPMVRLWGTYYGGTSQDYAFSSHSNSAGDVYISGPSISVSNIATTGAHQTIFAGGNFRGDAFVVKFSPSGTRVWATYYGGSGDDTGWETISDASGNLFMTGITESSSPGVIATPGSHQSVYSSAGTNTKDAFLVKFNSSGIRQWGTYYGGDDVDFAHGIALDNSGNIYISGAAASTSGIATPGSHQPTLASGTDAFLAKFNSAGVRQWGTYYGGNAFFEKSMDCNTNSSGDVYMVGLTSSSVGISTSGSHQSLYGGGPTNGNGDGFVAKFNSSGVCQWATYYGGAGSEFINHISIDSNGQSYCAGVSSTQSSIIIATPGSHQQFIGGGNDAFLVKFDPAGVRLWGTYYGGSGDEYGGSTAIDPTGNVFLCGAASTASGTQIATSCAYQSIYGGGPMDAFLAKFKSNGPRVWGTYYGGSDDDFTYSCSADGFGNVYLSGFGSSATTGIIASSNGHQPAYGGGTSDAFLVKFDGCIPGSATANIPAANLQVCSGNITTLTATCGDWYSSPTSTTALSTGQTYTTGAITSNTTFYVEDLACVAATGPRIPVTVSLSPAPNMTISNSNPMACVNESVTLTASGATTYSWISSSASTSTLKILVSLQTTYTVNGIGTNGCQGTATITVIPQSCNGLQENTLGTALSIFPNPNNGAFQISADRSMTLQLTNELGQVLKEIPLSLSNSYTATLDKLPAGVYLLTDKENTIRSGKIIVME